MDASYMLDTSYSQQGPSNILAALAPWDSATMSSEFDIEVLRRNLSDLLERKDIKPTTLSLRVGRSPTLVKDLLEKTSDVKLSTIFRIADELGVPLEALLTTTTEIVPAPMGPPLYVKGEVAAGVWRNALEAPRDEWKAFTGRPDVAAEVKHRFGLRVVGDSMNEIYPEGTIVECVSVFGHVEPAPGKRVVVVRQNEHGEVEATVKELVEQNGELWLVPRSTNPMHRPLRVNEPEPGIVEVRIAAVVVASVRPE